MWRFITTPLFVFFLAASAYPVRAKKNIRAFVNGVRTVMITAVLGTAFTVCALPTAVTTGDAGEGILTLARVIELAAANAPEVRVSTTRVAEAEARPAWARG
jgi:hypothetical protein